MIRQTSSYRTSKKSGANIYAASRHRFALIVYWSDADDAFIVEVPELPGCMADGQTYEQAVANARQVIEEWIETARELGRPVPEPKGRLMYA